MYSLSSKEHTKDQGLCHTLNLKKSKLNNAYQPPMETFVKIAELLEVDINELLRIEKQ